MFVKHASNFLKKTSPKLFVKVLIITTYNPDISFPFLILF